jgi:hypothetical protein
MPIQHDHQDPAHTCPICGDGDHAPRWIDAAVWTRPDMRLALANREIGTDGGMSVGYRRLLFHDLSVIFNAAVDDRVIPLNPCSAKTIKAPRQPPAKVTPWPLASLHAVRAAIRPRYAVTVDLGAGCGLREQCSKPVDECRGAYPPDESKSRNRVRPARQRGSGGYARAHGSHRSAGCASRAG